LTIVEFPDVTVDIKYKIETDPFFVGSLGVPVVGESVYLAYSLKAGIENTNKLIGGTIDEIANGARNIPNIPDLYKRRSDEDYLRCMIGEFARKKLVYGVALKEDEIKVEKILKNDKEIRNFLIGELFFDESKVKRTVFVPSDWFTCIAWGFEYKIEDLQTVRKIDDF